MRRILILALFLVGCGGDDAGGEGAEICQADLDACTVSAEYNECIDACPDDGSGGPGESCWLGCEPIRLADSLACETDVCGGDAPVRFAFYQCKLACLEGADYFSCTFECDAGEVDPEEPYCGPC